MGNPAGAGRRSELGLRILSGLVMALLALGFAWAGGVPFALFWLAAAIVIVAEWAAMTGLRPRAPVIGLSAAGLSASTLAAVAGAGPWIGLAVAVAAGLAILLAAAGPRDRLWGVSGFVYAASVAVAPVLVRDRYGLVGILWMFGVVWTTDVAAYFVGRRVGGPKLWPSVSPNKTWSGFVGGLVGGTAAATAIVAWSEAAAWGQPAGPLRVAPLAGVVALSAIASVTSQLGDLAESAMKRRAGVKDSGRLIPGHGGAMDRLDGFAAVALVCGFALLGARLAEHAP